MCINFTDILLHCPVLHSQKETFKQKEIRIELGNNEYNYVTENE